MVLPRSLLQPIKNIYAVLLIAFIILILFSRLSNVYISFKLKQTPITLATLLFMNYLCNIIYSSIKAFYKYVQDHPKAVPLF
jgi:hypothetical protein